MNCPTCGAEVVQDAGFCHKCGKRLETTGQRFPDDGPTVAPSHSANAEEQRMAEPPTTPAERFKQSATARHAPDDDAEEELWQGRYCPKAMIGAWALSGLISVTLLVIWSVWVRNGTAWLVLAVAILILWIYQVGVLKYRQWNIRYELTSQRFIHHTGILRRKTDRIELIDIDDITFEQSLLERLVGVGTIRIDSSDATDPLLVLRGIENVREVAEKIDDVRRAERRRRGLHIESI